MDTYNKIIQKVEYFTFYNHLIAQHLRKLKDNFGEKGCVFVYKGFPLYFMQQVQQAFISVSHQDVILEDNRINLDVVKSNPLGYFAAIQQAKENHASMWYEEFTIFSRNINPAMLPNKFVVIEN